MITPSKTIIKDQAILPIRLFKIKTFKGMLENPNTIGETNLIP